MTERPYQPRPRIRVLHFLEFKLLDLCCQFPNNQINQQDTGRVLLLSKSVGVLCQANRKPRSTSSKYILIILIGSNPFWHRGLETILHSTSYQDGVEYGWRLALHGIPSESSLSNVCFGHKQETNCLRRAESFLYRLALSTNCYLAVLNVFFSLTCLASYFRFREEAVKKSGNPNVMMKNPSEMENQVYLKAKTKVCAHSLIVSLCKERFITCNIALILWYCFESCWIHFDSDRFTNVAKVSLVLVWFSFWHL